MDPTVTTSPAGTEKTRVVTPEVAPTGTPPKSTGPPGESDCAEAAEANPASARRTSHRERQGVRVQRSWRERAPLGVYIPILHPAAREPVLRGATVGHGVAPEELAPGRCSSKKTLGNWRLLA